MADFVIELEHLINRHSIENDSNTPDSILAMYMKNCLDAFTVATRQRDDWYKPKQELAVMLQKWKRCWCCLKDFGDASEQEKYQHTKYCKGERVVWEVK